VEFIFLIFPVRGRGVYTPDIPCTRSWSLYSRYSLHGVVEFILPILPVRGHGVYTPDIPCTGSLNLYSPIFPVQGLGVCSLVNRETLLEWIQVGCPFCHYQWLFWDLNPQLTPGKLCILTAKPRLLPTHPFSSIVSRRMSPQSHFVSTEGRGRGGDV